MGIFRFLLALAVVITHATGYFVGIKVIPGYVCVELFFIISGFYMEFILSSSYKYKRDFYLSRFLRLWPLFVVITVSYLLFKAGFEWIANKPYTESVAKMYTRSNPLLKIGLNFSSFTMIGQDLFSLFYINQEGGIKFFYSNFLDGVDSSGYVWGGNLRLNGPAWSIGVEIWFYLLVPFLHKLKNSILLVLLILSAVLRIFLSKYIGLHTFFFFPTQFYLFLTGMIAFRYKEKLLLQGYWGKVFYFLLMVCVLSYFYIPVGKEFLRYFILPFVLFVSINSMFYSSLSIKWDRFVGDLSYPIYIMHSFVFLFFSRFFSFLHVQLNETTLNYLLYGIVVGLSALWVWQAERRLNKWRWKLSKKYD